jgi:hypothetical protein
MVRVRSTLSVLVAAAAVAGCKGSDNPAAIVTNPTLGTVAIVEDGKTCANYGVGPVQLFVDGTTVATPVMTPGQPTTVTVTPGSHTIIARDEDTSYQWPAQNVTVAAGAAVTVTLICV